MQSFSFQKTHYNKLFPINFIFKIMSYNPNFYNNIHGNFTFQGYAQNIVPPPPPPPPPPAYYIPPTAVYTSEKTDAEFVKSFEKRMHFKERIVKKKISISQVRDQLRTVVLTLNDLKMKEKMLEDQISTLSDAEWCSHMRQIEKIKIFINQTLSSINLDLLQKFLSKRSAKRLRLERVRMESKKEKEERIRESKERSRKIDENLQKIKDEINKVKQEEEAKMQADIVLKEVLRKKQDAKKCIIKLDALIKLRKARQNTAKGRGENVSESATIAFISNIDKLKSLWQQKLLAYEKEEIDLRYQLKEDTVGINESSNSAEKEVMKNIERWREIMFGGTLPQMDFGGDVGRFIAVRSQWDRYVSSEGHPLPVGWVLPTL